MRWLGYSMMAMLLAAILGILFMAVAASGRWVEFLAFMGVSLGVVAWVYLAVFFMGH